MSSLVDTSQIKISQDKKLQEDSHVEMTTTTTEVETTMFDVRRLMEW